MSSDSYFAYLTNFLNLNFSELIKILENGKRHFRPFVVFYIIQPKTQSAKF